MSRTKSLLPVCLALLLNSCTSGSSDMTGVEFPAMPPASQSRSGSPANYTIQVGDTLDVFVLEDSSFNGKYIVRPSGDVIIPKLGRIGVASMKLSDAEGAIKRALEASQLKTATVIADPVLRGTDTGETVLSGLTVYMSGGVAKAGRKFVPFVGGNSVTAFQAVMDSGGFTPFANKKKSFVLRRDATGATRRIALDFTKIESGTKPDMPLQDGDMLMVPQKAFGL